MESGAKLFMRKLKRVHFWILCPLAIVLGLVAWYLSVSSLKSETAKNSAKIKSLYGTVDQVRSKERHANDLVSAGMDALIEQRRQEVAAAWTERWNQQTSILTWPKELSEKFRQKVEGLRPIERFVDFPVPSEKELVRTLRMEYQEYIKKELVKLAEQIDSQWQPSGQVGGREYQGPDMMNRQIDHQLVAWNPANQADIEANHFDWSGTSRGGSDRDFGRQPVPGGDGIPTLLEILYAQEDLWVLRSIMGVIQRSNEGATTRFSAAVKEIHTIEIGRNAARSHGQLVQDGATSGEQGAGDIRGGEGGGPEAGGELTRERIEGGSGEMMQETPFGQITQDDTANMRYVDNNYQGLAGDRLRTVMKADEIDPADATLAVAKRMPVRMRLRVDQRKLNRVLAECASAELTIEVRQLRINPESSDGPQAGPPSREQPWSDTGSQQSSPANDLFQYDFDVELYGIVYIYNPVDNKILGTEDEPAASDESPPANEAVRRQPDPKGNRRMAA